ncbi:MAG: alkene reductase [Pseudomonadota bacterium]
MPDTSHLFTPATMGDLELSNRVFMAPLTRNRAQSDGTPKDMAQTYYRQRATAGLIFTEATQVSAMGKGYIDTPGIHDAAHVAAWKKITDAVHAEGGRIFLQLWHVGRISHRSLLPDGAAPVSSTDKAAAAQTFTAQGFEETSKPQALTIEGIAATVADFAKAAENAKAAGFDGVEVHAANGYLLDQFLRDGVNDRDDAYGGSIANRIRFVEEVIDAVVGVWGKDRVGLRLSPLGQFNDMSDSDPEALFAEVYKLAEAKGLAYLHVVELFPGAAADGADRALMKRLRAHFNGFYIANGDFDAESGAEAIASGHAQAITYGRPYIANPDLVERYRTGADLNTPDGDTFYGGNEKGYTDYPTLAQTP